MMGSLDFFNKDIDGEVNVATRLRQPGSSIKPLNYVTALMNGWTPATPIYDLATKFPNGNKPPYQPVNYDGTFRGLVSMRTALANSLNIPAVKTLYFNSNMTNLPYSMMDEARRMGITTFTDEDGRPYVDFGLPLTLGGGDVKLIELTQAYAVFANSGRVVPTTPFLKITDANGKVLYDLAGKDRPAGSCARFALDAPLEMPDGNGLCPQSAPYAYLITNMLSDNQARSLAFGSNSALKLSRPAAVKTGTTNDFRDNWTMGYTPDLVVGVWVGNSDNTQMKNVSGISGAAPIWHNVMERVLAERPKVDFVIPPGVVQVTICVESGLLPTDACPSNHRRKEYFVAGHEPKQNDTVWRTLAIDKDTNLLAGLECPPERVSMESFEVPAHDIDNLVPYDRIMAWAKGANWKLPPTEISSCATPAPSPVGD